MGAFRNIKSIDELEDSAKEKAEIYKETEYTKKHFDIVVKCLYNLLVEMMKYALFILLENSEDRITPSKRYGPLFLVFLEMIAHKIDNILKDFNSSYYIRREDKQTLSMIKLALFDTLVNYSNGKKFIIIEFATYEKLRTL